MNESQVVRIGVVGLGGYAGSIIGHLQQVQQRPGAGVQLIGACDPALEQHAEFAASLRDTGVTVLERFDELLQQPIDAVWLPVPIDLHRKFTEQALAAGKAVMCEKPAAGCIDDVDAMIAARDRAGLVAAVGFQATFSAITRQVKRRLLDGVIGPVRHATVCCCWPRGHQYYNRASWAGSLRRNGTWILDGPVQNACAHFITLPLFLLGPELDGIAQPAALEAELYRARDITSYDTASLRVTTAQGQTMLVLMTHACATIAGPTAELYGDKGVLRWASDKAQLLDNEGKLLEEWPPTVNHADMIERFAAAVRGQPDDERTLVTLELARPHVQISSAAVQTRPILNVPDSEIETAGKDANPVRAIRGIENAFEQCRTRRIMLHESGLLPWTTPPRTFDNLRDYRHFTGPAA